MIKNTIFAWCIFLVGIAFVCGVDWIQRTEGGGTLSDGLPVLVWYGLHASVAVVSIMFLVLSVKGLRTKIGKIAYLLVNILLGYAVYIFGLLTYITETGIDSL